MVLPLTATGSLDEPAATRILDHLETGGVHGVFVLGTTGESPRVPETMALRLVEVVTAHAQGRMRIYAGISHEFLEESVIAGNRFFALGVDAVVAHAPKHYKANPKKTAQYFTELAGRLNGELMIYNIPLTTNLSLPISACKAASRQPRVIGLKDSENDPKRLRQLLREFGGRQSFSVFVGTGALMAEGLLEGADGIVPSVGNLVPRLCRQFYDSVPLGDPAQTQFLHHQLMDVAHVYQKGRALGESLAALKAAMSCLGLCQPDVLPPLKPLLPTERTALRSELVRLGLLAHNSEPNEATANLQPHSSVLAGTGSRPAAADSP